MFRGTVRSFGTLLLVLAAAMPAWGKSPLVTELAAFFTQHTFVLYRL